MAEALVGEAWRGEKRYAFYLTKMGLLAQGKEVKQLGNVVSPIEIS